MFSEYTLQNCKGIELENMFFWYTHDGQSTTDRENNLVIKKKYTECVK